MFDLIIYDYLIENENNIKEFSIFLGNRFNGGSLKDFEFDVISYAYRKKPTGDIIDISFSAWYNILRHSINGEVEKKIVEKKLFNLYLLNDKICADFTTKNINKIINDFIYILKRDKTIKKLFDEYKNQ